MLLTPDFWLLTSALPTNEAGMWLIQKGIQVYVDALREHLQASTGQSMAWQKPEEKTFTAGDRPF